MVAPCGNARTKPGLQTVWLFSSTLPQRAIGPIYLSVMKPILVLPMLATLALSACSVFGIRTGTPEPKFSVISHLGPVEIRQYAPRIAAETTLDTSAETARYQGFRRLAAYIFGANHSAAKIAMTAPVAQSATNVNNLAQSATKIAMTAPVAQSRSPQGWTIRFFMPAGDTLETLPIPNNPEIHLVSVPAADYAVLRFTGSRSPRAIAAKQAILLRSLVNSPWQPTGTPTAWFYDPPWTLPFLRRNEVAIEVTKTTP